MAGECGLEDCVEEVSEKKCGFSGRGGDASGVCSAVENSRFLCECVGDGGVLGLEEWIWGLLKETAHSFHLYAILSCGNYPPRSSISCLAGNV